MNKIQIWTYEFFGLALAEEMLQSTDRLASSLHSLSEIHCMPSALGMPPLSYGSRAVLDARRLIIDWGKYNYTALEINEGIDRPPTPPPLYT